MKIKIIDIEITTPGKYSCAEVSYKNLDAAKVESRKVMSFGASENAFKVLKDASTGQFFNVTTKKILNPKDQKEYWNWIDVVPTTEDTESVPQAAPDKGLSDSSYGPMAAPTKSTYETPEERAKKQVYIVRQSSITSAMAFHDLIKTKNVSVDFILATAKEFENYVFGIATSPPAPVTSLADMEDDIPH